VVLVAGVPLQVVFGRRFFQDSIHLLNHPSECSHMRSFVMMRGLTSSTKRIRLTSLFGRLLLGTLLVRLEERVGVSVMVPILSSAHLRVFALGISQIPGDRELPWGAASPILPSPLSTESHTILYLPGLRNPLHNSAACCRRLDPKISSTFWPPRLLKADTIPSSSRMTWFPFWTPHCALETVSIIVPFADLPFLQPYCRSWIILWLLVADLL